MPKKKTDKDLINGLEVRGIFLAKQELTSELASMEKEHRHLCSVITSDKVSLSEAKERVTRLEISIRDRTNAADKIKDNIAEGKRKLELARKYWKGKKD
jgi:hypothetical protein